MIKTISINFSQSQLSCYFKDFKTTYESCYKKVYPNTEYNTLKGGSEFKNQLKYYIDTLKKIIQVKKEPINKDNPKDKETILQYQTVIEQVNKIMAKIVAEGINIEMKEISQISLAPVKNNLTYLKNYLQQNYIQRKSLKNTLSDYITKAENELAPNKMIQGYFKNIPDQTKDFLTPIHKYIMKRRQSTQVKTKGSQKNIQLKQQNQYTNAILLSLQDDNQRLNNQIRTFQKQNDNIVSIVDKLTKMLSHTKQNKQTVFNLMQKQIKNCFESVQKPLSLLVNKIMTTDNFEESSSSFSSKSQSTKTSNSQLSQKIQQYGKLLKQSQDQNLSLKQQIEKYKKMTAKANEQRAQYFDMFNDLKAKTNSPTKSYNQKNSGSVNNTNQLTKITIYEKEIQNLKKQKKIRENNQQIYEKQIKQLKNSIKQKQTMSKQYSELIKENQNLKTQIKNQQNEYAQFYKSSKNIINQNQKYKNQLQSKSNKSPKQKIAVQNIDQQNLTSRIFELNNQKQNLKNQIITLKNQMQTVNLQNQNKIYDQNEQYQLLKEQYQILKQKSLQNNKIKKGNILQDKLNYSNSQKIAKYQAEINQLKNNVKILSNTNANLNKQINSITKTAQQYELQLQFKNQKQNKISQNTKTRQKKLEQRLNQLMIQRSSLKQQLKNITAELKNQKQKMQQNVDECKRQKVINQQLHKNINDILENMSEWNSVLQVNSQKDIASYHQKWAMK